MNEWKECIDTTHVITVTEEELAAANSISGERFIKTCQCGLISKRAIIIEGFSYLFIDE